ncbi:polyketide synthase, partial [Aureobasidium melanogenum]
MRAQSPIEPIAVVGISLRLPGDANDLDGLWKLLESGAPAWTPVPADRYNEDAFFHPNADDLNGTSNHPGGHFISGDVRDFDHTFFRFTKSQAAAIDPQQRLLMELSYEALESAGITLEQVKGSATSVYAAVFPSDYGGHLYRDPLDLPTYYMTGVQQTILANRISHVFDLRGPSFTLDTACSGGLVALHQACQSLRDSESDTAIVGASNLILSPDHFVGLSNLHMLSSTGRCYPFDIRGKGYGRGEGVVVLVVKRLEDAIRDRDPVRAIVRSTAIGQDGYTPQSITYPNGQAQASLARTAYARAGLQPEEVAYVEAHGTGTKAGDKEEMEGLIEVFADTSHRPVPLYIGSIKGAIGHTEAAAGLASFAKSVTMLERGLIPPVAGFEIPKSGLPFDKMQIPTKVVPWPRVENITPRISINSFGFGGANAHCILEGSPESPGSIGGNESTPRLYTFSANSMASLKGLIESHLDWIEKRVEMPLADLSYTLLHRRSALPYRFSAVADDRQSLMDVLHQNLALAAVKSASSKSDLIMVFTGQGAQWPGMGRELLSNDARSGVFRDSILSSRDILRTLGATWDLETELLRGADESRLNEAELAQPVSTAVQIALVQLLRAHGARPNAVVGHSAGEIAAAYAAGHLSQATAIELSFHRGFMAKAAEEKGLGLGAMLSVGMGEHDAARHLKDLTKGRAVVACINSPKSITISGDADAVNEFEERIVAFDKNIFHRKLLVPTAYHSHHMQAVADDYRFRLGNLDLPQSSHPSSKEEVMFVSSVTGKPKTAGFDAEYWIANLTSPVHFSDAVQTLCKTRQQPGISTIFAEIGPAPVLAGPVRQCLQDPDMPKIAFEYQAPLQRNVSSVTSVLEFAGRMFELDVKIDWNAVSTLMPGMDMAKVRHDLPAYTWDHSTKHWHESRVAKAYRLRKEPYHDLCGTLALDATDIEPRWRHFLGRSTLPWLSDHVVDGLTVFPGAGYCCMAIEAISQLVRSRHSDRLLETVVLRDIEFKRGLVIPETGRVELQLSFKPIPEARFGFKFTITAIDDSGNWYEHCTGVVEGLLAETGVKNQPAQGVITNGYNIHISSELPSDNETVPREVLYQEMDKMGNTYGPAFVSLDYETFSPDSLQAEASFQVLDIQSMMPAKHQRPHIIHPSTLDIVFHTALPLVSRRLGPGSKMPTKISEMLVSVDSALHVPGSLLQVSDSITSSHFRTAITDISAAASNRSVLTIAGMEFRSLGARDDENLTDLREICYELDMQPAIDYARLDDLPTSPTLLDLIARTTMSQHGLSLIGLGASIDLTEEYLHAVSMYNKVLTYDFVDASPGRFIEAAKRLDDYQVQFRTIKPGTRAVARGFEPGTYNIVLVGSTRWLDQAAELVKSDGIVLLVLTGQEAQDDRWRNALSKKGRVLEEQLSFSHENRLIAVTKLAITPLPNKIRIISHSTNNTPAWVSAIHEHLVACNIDVSLETLTLDSVKPLCTGASISMSKADTVLVVDDIADSPILLDSTTFSAAIELMKGQHRVVWIGPNEPATFHQIEGVSRTAHAENDNLCLTTIHSSPSLLENPSGFSRLIDVVTDTVSRISNPQTPHAEREYRILSDGAVVVPRLHHSDKLNRAIDEKSSKHPVTELRSYVDGKHSLMLVPDDSGLYAHQDEVLNGPLTEDDIEMDIQAFSLAKLTSNLRFNGYAGTVIRVGPNVKNISPGDRVVTISDDMGANRLRVSQLLVGHMPKGMTYTTGAAVFLDAMTAVYAMCSLARLLSDRNTVLINGARTSAGRAAIAVARSLGSRVTAMAADSKEARLLEAELGIGPDDVLLVRRSQYRRSAADLFGHDLDLIVQAGDENLPTEVLAQIKPFGCVVVTSSSAKAVEQSTLPDNTSVHVVGIARLLHDQPDLAASLISKAAAVLDHMPLAGIDITTRSVAEAPQAIRLINTGVHSKIVLQAEADSAVEVVLPQKHNYWANGDATYLVAGGLGDIGQRILTIMAARGVKHVATLSRDPKPHVQCEVHSKLEAIQPGIKLYALKGNVSSKASIQAAAASLVQQGAPPVRGVIMAATYMNDRPLELLTFEDYLSVTKIKVDGTPALYQAFASDDLKFFLSLSSVASIIGAQAEASYNAGNALQDSLAHQEKQHGSGGTRFFTVNFGWIEDAILTAGDDTREGAMDRAGFAKIKQGELARFFEYILDAVQDPETRFSQAVIGFDADSLGKSTFPNSNIRSSMFNEVRDRRRPAGATNESDEGATGRTFDEVVAHGDIEEITDHISQATRTHLARLISMDLENIEVRQGSILALGLDSLVAVELRNWVMRQFDAPLQSMEILANQTIYALAEKIVGRSKKIAAVA